MNRWHYTLEPLSTAYEDPAEESDCSTHTVATRPCAAITSPMENTSWRVGNIHKLQLGEWVGHRLPIALSGTRTSQRETYICAGMAPTWLGQPTFTPQGPSPHFPIHRQYGQTKPHIWKPWHHHRPSRQTARPHQTVVRGNKTVTCSKYKGQGTQLLT